MIRSRIGLEREGVLLEELTQMSDVRLQEYDCIILDELSSQPRNRWNFWSIWDDLDIPVICYGLRTDFRHEFFEGSKWLMAWADKVEELRKPSAGAERRTLAARDRRGRPDGDCGSGDQVVWAATTAVGALPETLQPGRPGGQA